MAIDLEEELKRAGKNPAVTDPFGPSVPTLGQGLTGMSSAISGVGVSNPPPAMPASPPAGDAATVQEGLNRYANANRIRGEMINSSIQANGGNGVGVLQTEQTLPGGMSVSDWNNRVSAGFNTQMSPKQKAEYLANEGSMGIQRESQNVLRRGQDVQLMGSEMQARRAAAHDNTIMRGQDLTAAEAAARLGIDKEKVGILQADSARLGAKTAIENAKTQGEIDDKKMLLDARAGLNAALASGDPRKIEQAKMSAIAAGIKFDSKPEVTSDYKPDGMGMGGTAVQRTSDGSLITTRIGANGKVGAPVKIAAPGATMEAAPSPDKREIGKVYQTPKGPLVWRGDGWEAAR